MHKTDRNRIFRQSVQAYRLGRLDEAAHGFRSLVDSGTIDPLHQSFHGLMLALRENRPQEGRELCERALVLIPDRPEAYLNLARVYKSIGRKRRSIDTLRRGLSVRPKHPDLLREIKHASPRRKPPIRNARARSSAHTSSWASCRLVWLPRRDRGKRPPGNRVPGLLVSTGRSQNGAAFAIFAPPSKVPGVCGENGPPTSLPLELTYKVGTESEGVKEGP